MLTETTNVLVTGVTGLIGGELIPPLLQAGAGRVLCLIRPSSCVQDRLAHRLGRTASPIVPDARVRAVAGDVALPRFGLHDDDYDDIIGSVDVVIHCASELSFIRDAHCRRTNILGMHNLVDLVRHCRREPRIVHVGTAASCGAVSHRCMSESDGSSPDTQHHNEYTRTKAVAEQVLRESGLPSLVLRPSITLAAGVPSRKFARAIAWFLPLLRHFDAIPLDPSARVDIVPVAFVVNAMVRLLQKPSLRYDCYNLSAGPDHATVCGAASAYMDTLFERPEPLRLVPPGEWTREMHRRYLGSPDRRKMFSTLKYYLPFLNMDVVYDNARLREELAADMPDIPPLENYLGNLLSLVGIASEQSADPVAG